jgi:hypothetical protein
MYGIERSLADQSRKSTLILTAAAAQSMPNAASKIEVFRYLERPQSSKIAATKQEVKPYAKHHRRQPDTVSTNR